MVEWPRDGARDRCIYRTTAPAPAIMSMSLRLVANKLQRLAAELDMGLGDNGGGRPD